MVLPVLVAGLAAVCAQAQALATDSGVLSGRVVAADGRPLAGVRVTAVFVGEDSTRDAPRAMAAPPASPVSPASVGPPALAGLPAIPQRAAEPAATVTTDRQGVFVFLRLGAGWYQLSVSMGGDAVSPVGSARVDAMDAMYVVLQAGTTAGGSFRMVGPARLDPLAGHDPEAEPATDTESAVAVRSSPGDRADTPEENEAHASDAGPEPASGESGIPGQGAAMLDGLSAQQGLRSGGRSGGQGGLASGATFARGGVRSLRAGTGAFSAAVGGIGSSGAGMLAMGFRVGAAGVHGGGFATVRLSAFDAANPYAVATHYQDGAITSGVVKPGDTDVQAGVHVGFAPLAGWNKAGAWRERVFGFAAVEGRVREAPVESTPAVASFYALTPTQSALLANRGVSGTQVNAALDYLDGLSGEIARSETRLLSFGRLDVRASSHDAVAVTFADSHLRSPAGAEFDQLADAVVASGRGSVGDSAVAAQAVAGQWARRFTPRLENAVRVQFVHDLESELPRAPLPQEPAISPGGEAPEVEIAPQGFTYGTAANLDRTAYPDEHRVEVANTLRWVPGALRGRHVLMVGGDWSRVADRVDTLRNANGTFLYDSDDANGRAGGLVDWITDATFNVHAYPNGGCPSITAAVHDFCFRTYTQSFGTAEQRFATHEFAGSAEDSFLAHPDLRLTLGVRYEYTLLPLPQVPNMGLDASLRGLALPGELAGVTAAFPEDRNNVGPRVGVAWSPHGGRWATVRAGYGWFYGRLPGTTLRAALADNDLASGIAQVRITPETVTACPQVASLGSNQGFGYPCAFAGQPPSAVAQTGTAMVFAGRFRLPAIQRATLAVERSVGKRVELELRYAGAVAVQLPTSVDVNIAPATSLIHFALQGGAEKPGLASGRTFAVPLYTARRLAGYGPVTAITSQANATYHAGTLAARLRVWDGVEARGSVTYSRAIDDNPESGAGSGPRVDGSFDPFAIGYDKGLSDSQAALRFAGSVVGRSALRRGPRLVRAGLSGWRVAASATASSGAPYSYEIFGGTRLSGGYASINGSGGETFLPTVGRNTLRLPARANVDLRLERGGSVRGVKLSGFAEAFNLLNERNLSRVETRAFLLGTTVNGVTPLVFQDAAAVASEGVTTPAFGMATSSTSSGSRERLVALGVRVEF